MPNVSAAVKQVRRKGMSQLMRGDPAESRSVRDKFKDPQDHIDGDGSASVFLPLVRIRHQASKDSQRFGLGEFGPTKVDDSSSNQVWTPSVVPPVANPLSPVQVHTTALPRIGCAENNAGLAFSHIEFERLFRMFTEEHAPFFAFTTHKDRPLLKVDMLDSHCNDFTGAAARGVHDFDDCLVACGRSRRNELLDFLFWHDFWERTVIGAPPYESWGNGVNDPSQIQEVKERLKSSEKTGRALHRDIASCNVNQKVPDVMVRNHVQRFVAKVNTKLTGGTAIRILCGS
ncbi:MAG TPA: hypothetical protein VKP61_17205 [Candidatus Acidoferrum sp.]|nr:hypothetical protein [Candidatus Acidoferrum sp.]